jgi:CBS-domain-containing membrane protein
MPTEGPTIDSEQGRPIVSRVVWADEQPGASWLRAAQRGHVSGIGATARRTTMGKRVRDAMTADPRTVRVDDAVVEAATIMEEEDVGSVPVVDVDNVLVGMITDRDIALRVVAAGRDPRTTQPKRSRPRTSALPIRTSRSMRHSSRWPIVRFGGCR